MASHRIDFADWIEAPQTLAPGETIFAIGDVHGHAAHLEALHATLRTRISDACAPEKTTIVWLGDYIDRGPENLRALDLVREGLGLDGLTEVRLRGNHDQYLIDALDAGASSRERLAHWRRQGGDASMRDIIDGECGEKPREVSKALQAGLGDARIAFLNGLELSRPIGPYLVAHAGAHPEKPLEKHDAEIFLWIREPFLSARKWGHDFTVIHGHTPGALGVFPHRIGVDSGCYMTDMLSVVEICGSRLRFITAQSA